MSQIIYRNVSLGHSFKLGHHVILGEPPKGFGSGELQTVIGALAVIRSHTVIYAGNHIGNYFQTGHHVMIRENNIIGNHVSIGSATVIEHHTVIEDWVRIHSQAFIPEYCRLQEGCWLGPNVVLTNAKYPNQPNTKENLAGVTVGRKAVIGANATILPGIVVGAGAIVGAGAVVVRDVPAGVVIYGNPARICGNASDIGYNPIGNDRNTDQEV